MDFVHLLRFSFLSLFSIGIFFPLLAQQRSELDKALLVKISPLSFLEPETIVIQGGIEYFFSTKFSVQSEIGINGGVFGIPSGRGKNEDFSLWRSKNELKYHAKNFYVGLELFFVQKNFIRSDDSYSAFNVETWYDTARINFQVFGTGLKFGHQAYISDNILLDSFVGFGFRGRYREVKVIELSAFQSSEYFEETFFVSSRYNFDGWDSVPQFTIGVKIGILTGKQE
jgi:hypothetical protein